MNKKIRRFIAMIAAFCIAFTGIPLMTGSLDAHAASKFTIKTAEAVSSSAVKLTWKKYKKSNAYEVYRDGELVERLSKTTFMDEGLEASTEYVYKVKALKKYTKKQKQWFNKKTGEWQTKKPAKKYRGKSKTVKLIKYKNLGTSKPRVVETKAPERVPFDDTDRDQDVSSDATVKVYALSSINVTVDYSEAEGASGLKSVGYTEQYQYNKNGLLKKSSSNANPDEWGSHTGIRQYSYTGSKVREMYLSSGEFMPEKYTYTYENGKLKSATHTYPDSEDEEPFTEYYNVNSMGRVDSVYYTLTTGSETEEFGSYYSYSKEGYLTRYRYDSNTDHGDTYDLDEKGNVKKYVYTGVMSPMSSQVKTITNTAENKYTNGNLSETLITNYYGVKTRVALNYKEISIPEEYQKAFAAQQHDILFHYVYDHITNHSDLIELPLGLVG